MTSGRPTISRAEGAERARQLFGEPAYFTRGPWGLAPESNGTEFVAYSTDPWRVRAVLIRGDFSQSLKRGDTRVMAAAPDYHEACGGLLHPGEAADCGPLAWLREAVATLERPEVRAADISATGSDDPGAYDEMVAEVRALYDALAAAYRKGRGQ